MTYRFSRETDEDVVRIYLEGLHLFELLAANPRMARERSEIVPPVRIHPYRAHLIVYVIEPNDDVLIVRIRHGHEDWSEQAW